MFMVVNSPPALGSFSVTPTTGGIASGSNGSTVFFFSAPDWLDEATDLPLTYELLYFITNTTAPTLSPVQVKSQNSIANSKLPPGVQSSRFIVFNFANIRDSFDALAVSETVEVESQLQAGVSATDAVASALAESLDTALNSADSSVVALRSPKWTVRSPLPAANSRERSVQ